MGRKQALGPKRANDSFKNLVSHSNREALKPFISQEVDRLGGQLARQQAQTIETIFIRVMNLEKLMQEKHGITDEELAMMIASTQDQSQNFEEAKEAKKGDRVRIAISTKTADQEEFQGNTKMMIDNLGSGKTIGIELELAVVGLKAGDTKQIPFGEDDKMLAEITVNRVSRKLAPPAPPEVEEIIEENKEEENADVDSNVEQ